MLPDGGFILDHERSIIEENQYCYALSSERGEGYFWYYFYEDMFVIEKQDFFFYDEFFWSLQNPILYLSSISFRCLERNFILIASYHQTA